MYLLSIKLLWADKVIPALCWMLVHSLWQGLILATLAGIIILNTKRSFSATRYNLLSGAFLLFIAGLIFTFYRELELVGEQIKTRVSAAITEKYIPAAGVEADKYKVTLVSSVVSYLNEHAATIVFIWFLIIGMRSIRLIGGLHGIHQMKRKLLSSPGAYWRKRIQELSAELGIHQPVRFLQSGIAKVPLVLGHFKPLILFPIGLLASIPSDEVEAILLHELAHIRRKDYLVNMLQNFIEISFFFNPAAIWVSSLIKFERENCCDDIAVAKTNNKSNYIRALLSFQEYSLASQPLATALTDKKFHLLDRVKRIICNNNKTLTAMEKTLLVSGLVIAAFVVLAFSPNLPQRPGLNRTAPARYLTHPAGEKTFDFLAAGKDTIPAIPPLKGTVPADPDNKMKEKFFSNINTIVDGKRYELILKNGMVTELYIEGNRIPGKRITDHNSVIIRIIKEAKENWAREMRQAEMAKQQAELSEIQSEQSMIPAEKSQEIAELLKSQAEESSRREAELAKLGSQQSMLQAERSEELAGMIRSHIEKSVNAQVELAKLEAEQSMVQAERTKELAKQLKLETERYEKREKELSMLRTKELRIKAEAVKKQVIQLSIEAEVSKELAKELEMQAEKSMKRSQQSQLDAREMENNIIDGLIHEKLIKDKKNLAFTLNNEELIVNGVKQPESLHKKLKEKYVKGPDWNYNYDDRTHRE